MTAVVVGTRDLRAALTSVRAHAATHASLVFQSLDELLDFIQRQTGSLKGETGHQLKET